MAWVGPAIKHGPEVTVKKERLTMSKNRAFLLTLCAAVGAFGAASVRAQDHDYGTKHFKIYAGPAYVSPLGDDDITLGAVTDSLETQDHVGWNLGFEGRFGKLMGIELDYVNASQDVDFGGSTIGDTTFSPLTATLNFHIVPGDHFDLYLGPSYTYVNWGDIEGGTSTVGTDSSHGWGVSLGMDISPWEHFGFYAGLKYLNVDLELNNGQSASMNPLVGRLGALVRF